MIDESPARRRVHAGDGRRRCDRVLRIGDARGIVLPRQRRGAIRRMGANVPRWKGRCCRQDTPSAPRASRREGWTGPSTYAATRARSTDQRIGLRARGSAVAAVRAAPPAAAAAARQEVRGPHQATRPAAVPDPVPVPESESDVPAAVGARIEQLDPQCGAVPVGWRRAAWWHLRTVVERGRRRRVDWSEVESAWWWRQP